MAEENLNRYAASLLISLLIVLASLFVSSPVVGSYLQLEEKLEESEIPSAEFVDQLPEPQTARQYWLLSQVTEELSLALERVEKAVEKAEDDWIAYFDDWLQMNLLGFQGDNEFFVDHLVKLLESEKKPDTAVFLRAGRVAEEQQLYSHARELYEEAYRMSDNYQLKLKLARVLLQLGKLEQADRLLEDYFLSGVEEQRPDYWLIRGEFYELSGADTDAYLAYSHLVDNYPEALLVVEAEKRIERLGDMEGLDRLSDRRVARQKSLLEKPHYRVQVGAFRRRSEAETKKQNLLPGPEEMVLITEAEVNGQLFYRVQVVTGAERSTAQNYLKKLSERGLDGFIVHVD